MTRRDLGPLAAPPPSLATRTLPLTTWVSTLVRLHRLDHAPLFFGRTGMNRFDAPDRSYGVLYAAADLHGAFIETFGDAGGHVVTVSSLTTRAQSVLLPIRALSLVDLRGAGLSHIGADARLFAADRRPAQIWSQALWKHPEAIDGLCYRARHDSDRVSVAVFDRAADALDVSSTQPLMARALRSALADVLDHYNFGLIDA